MLRRNGALFAKNSDRPFAEPQVPRVYPARAGGGELRTQYLTIDDLGAVATVLSQPTWLWGAEHGVNEYGVAIGNEKVYGTEDPYSAPPGLIGMDLVRLGLDRGRNAGEAIDVITTLLERHGQGGVADCTSNEPYWSSFLVVDPTAAWILETCGRTWAAKPVVSDAAISNRIAIRSDWTLASVDVARGSDFDRWRNPEAPTGHADRRLESSLAYLKTAATNGELAGPSGAVGHLRDHGSGPWGRPGDLGDLGEVVEPPEAAHMDGRGVTVCMHVRGFLATTASLVAELPDDPVTPIRAWAAMGSPCASVYVPFVMWRPDRGKSVPIAEFLSDEAMSKRFASLRRTIESKPGSLDSVRSVLSRVENDLWEQADGLGNDPAAWDRFAHSASAQVVSALEAVESLLGTVTTDLQ
jgi:secernin